eukprot:1479818-Pleurochrysis_carterae.AAC.1
MFASAPTWSVLQCVPGDNGFQHIHLLFFWRSRATAKATQGLDLGPMKYAPTAATAAAGSSNIAETAIRLRRSGVATSVQFRRIQKCECNTSLSNQCDLPRRDDCELGLRWAAPMISSIIIIQCAEDGGCVNYPQVVNVQRDVMTTTIIASLN